MNIPPWNPVIRRVPPNRLSKDGAQMTANDIIHIWRAHGYQNVTAEVVPLGSEYGGRDGPNIYGVKTNLVRGLPPRVLG